MIHDPPLDGLGGLQLALRDQLEQVVGVVNDLPLGAEVGVLVGERVEAVRTGGDDLLGAALLAIAVDGRDVRLRQHQEQQLVAGSACGVARARLLLAEDREIDAGLLQQLRPWPARSSWRDRRSWRRSRPRTARRPSGLPPSSARRALRTRWRDRRVTGSTGCRWSPCPGRAC